MTLKKYANFLSRARRGAAYWTRVAMRDFTEELLARMGSSMSRAALADAAGVSPSYITKVLRGSENFTIETMTKLALAVGGKVRLHIADLDAETRWFDSYTTTSVKAVGLRDVTSAPELRAVAVSTTSGREYPIESRM